ncbi:Aminotransferase, class I/classII domain and Pyridoxal phosphate-dependent transferase, major region, subdomain 1 and Pyridoxal phosphate-dependent transferase, major region, subdomain 2 and Pyridoxal phosphate-dependent transferase domain-containing protein [Strongyloides ratti]|uniref:Aminotran_1_2 domain-containing protein n=1 Tax=Strongyloides ratti TaxID=34506 RepID=A0A090LMJ5_STRRB|nr:Aminotransferase, class I/classII domain and Pyridoxal phosphate-dependent transferase, major region, subdomain 1 and Pyridoxal phosphate-dependent transferase, major region, subdomain 2 and Pyridoxal phosphate-dependent transferase domain-containing protein [Strongyloides ratti]CEF69388.1 Aminotransferase, class I/classII domain and Pyridoxal phosphate-dependent transferase, major region, subdomain 1 and Pyridoxal phosphate-dependent transferase, major region, subdomain 2 and Pyridoxal phospha
METRKLDKIYELVLRNNAKSQNQEETFQEQEIEDDPDNESTCSDDFTSATSPQNKDLADLPEAPFLTNIMVYFHYFTMVSFAVFSAWLRSTKIFKIKYPQELESQKEFPSLDNKFETLFINSIYRMATDVVNRPISSVPSTKLTIKERITNDYGWSYEFTGFSQNYGPCASAAINKIDEDGLSVCSTKHELGNTILQREVEKQVANFIGVEDAIIFPMGFGTNSMNISAFVNDDCIVFSDQLNHSSIVTGCRMSKATIKVFKHNDPIDLERVIRKTLPYGNPKKGGSKYKKILIIVEGIYSMEGTIVDLPAIVAIKKKYNAYLFLDEAHSIGAMGPNGKGVVDYFGMDPSDVDIMMGTLTKSFAAAGGYIGGSKKTIDHIRACSIGAIYGSVYSAPILAQIQSSIRIIEGRDGTNTGLKKINNLLRNSRYFRDRLKQMGFHVCGSRDSPVIPVMTYFISKVVAFGREALLRNLGVVSVGYPATPLTAARIRFCMCADHTKEQLDLALEIIDEVGTMLGIKYATVTEEMRNKKIVY